MSTVPDPDSLDALVVYHAPANVGVSHSVCEASSASDADTLPTAPMKSKTIAPAGTSAMLHCEVVAPSATTFTSFPAVTDEVGASETDTAHTAPYANLDSVPVTFAVTAETFSQTAR